MTPKPLSPEEIPTTIVRRPPPPFPVGPTLTHYIAAEEEDRERRSGRVADQV